MLTDKLRDGAHGRVFKILFWIIILSFVFAGVGNYLIPRLDTSPAKVGDYEVRAEQWGAQYQDQVRALQAQYGAQAATLLEDPKAVKTLRMQVLESMIDNIALNSVIFEQGIRIGDEQVKSEIRKDKTFFTDGKFDNNKFLAIVRNMGSSPDYYAEGLRSQLASTAFASPIIRAAQTAYPYEIKALSKLLAQKRIVDLYSVDTKSLEANISITDDDTKKYYDEHHDFFMKPSSVVFNYILLSKDELKKDIKPTDEDLENFYSLNQSDFTVEQKREASQILIKKSTENFEQKAKDALAALKSGTNFNEVGEKYSDSLSFKDDHGSLGLLEKGELSASLDVALFGLAAEGSYSNVIVDDAGAHILRLDKIQAEYVPELAKIKEDVKAKYIDDKALEIYNEKSSTLADKSYEQPDSLDIAAQEIGAEIKASGLVPLGDSSVAWPLNTNEVQKVAFNEETRSSHQNSNIISLANDACIVINVSEYNEASLEKFEDVKDKALRLAKDAVLKQEQDKLLASIQGEILNGKTPELTNNIKLEKNVEISQEKTDIPHDFLLEIMSIENKVNSSTMASNNGVQTLAVLKDVQEVTVESQEQYENLLKAQLMQIKQQLTSQLLHSGAREISEVKYNEDAINQTLAQSNTLD